MNFPLIPINKIKVTTCQKEAQNQTGEAGILIGVIRYSISILHFLKGRVKM
jgi:hypothetical protein